MNVLSLFDGCSCGRVALERAGIKVDNYWASEVDKYAIQVSQKNWPDIEHIGDVCGVDATGMDVDLLIGGSPCQGFSFAGKQLNFDDPRSKLFFEYVRILKECKPKWFLLENVKMKKESQDVISEALGVEPVEINSALVSAQNRKRLYWTNIPFEMPEDKGILLKDVVLNGDIPVVIQTNFRYLEGGMVRATTLKSPTILSGAGGGHIPHFIKRVWQDVVFSSDCDEDGNCPICGIDYADCPCLGPTQDGVEYRVHRGVMQGRLENQLVHSEKALDYMDRRTRDGRTHWDFQHHSDVRDTKSSAVVANFFKGVPYNVLKDWDCIRKFSPIECERLQTLPDNYTEGVSNTQRYKMIGNGWTVDVITHILKGINND